MHEVRSQARHSEECLALQWVLALRALPMCKAMERRAVAARPASNQPPSTQRASASGPGPLGPLPSGSPRFPPPAALPALAQAMTEHVQTPIPPPEAHPSATLAGPAVPIQSEAVDLPKWPPRFPATPGTVYGATQLTLWQSVQRSYRRALALFVARRRRHLAAELFNQRAQCCHNVHRRTAGGPRDFTAVLRCHRNIIKQTAEEAQDSMTSRQ
jgi:hypothetical protein